MHLNKLNLVTKLSNITWYCIQQDKYRTWVRLWTHKKHPMIYRKFIESIVKKTDLVIKPPKCIGKFWPFVSLNINISSKPSGTTVLICVNRGQMFFSFIITIMAHNHGNLQIFFFEFFSIICKWQWKHDAFNSLRPELSVCYFKMNFRLFQDSYIYLNFIHKVPVDDQF